MLPAEKVLKEGDEGFVKHEPAQGDGNAANGGAVAGSTGLSPNDADAVSKLFETKFGVNITEGLRNCSGAEIYMDAARNFYDAIEEKSGDIEQFAAVEDWTNYTVLVHANMVVSVIDCLCISNQEHKAVGAIFYHFAFKEF